MRGSSPLARGLHHNPNPVTPRRRIIPARAGFTHKYRSIHSLVRDHPRSRGVYSAARRNRSPSGGSSPLARGLPGARGGPSVSRGIIAARAGFTCSLRRRRRWPADHPRSRGVYATGPPTRGAASGSSPLARGLRRGLASEAQGVRIIPARAGFTQCCACGRGDTWDHPRSRGVYASSWYNPPSEAGSSPLARGLRDAVYIADAAHRIIPARAGFT